MDDELVLLTSYFNLSDGHRRNSPDTFRVEPSVPSATAPGGSAAVYVLTEASASGQAGQRARKRAADTVLWQYEQGEHDTPIARLRAALRAAHNTLTEEFDGHVTVGVSVMAVEQDTVYLGQVAPAQVYVLHEGSLHSITAAAPGSSPFSQALGSSEGPQIAVFKDQVAPDDVVALTSSWFFRAADPEAIKECFGAGGADEIAESMLDLAKQHDLQDGTAIVVEARLGSEMQVEGDDDHVSFMEQVDGAVQALTGVGKMLWTELRTSTPNSQRDGLNGVNHAEDVVMPSNGQGHARSLRNLWSRGSGRDTPVLDTETQVQDPDTPFHEEMTAETPRVSSRRPDPEPKPKARESRRGSTERDDTVSRGEEPSSPPASSSPSSSPIPNTPPSSSDRGFGRDDVTQELPAISDEDWNDWDSGAGASTEAIEPAAPDEPETPHETLPRRETLPKEEPRRTRRGAHPLSRERNRQQPRDLQDTAPASTKTEAPSELDRVNSRLQRSQEMEGIVPPVQAFDPTSVEPERIYATSKDIQAVNKRPRRFGGIARPGPRDPIASAPVLRPGVTDVDLSRPVTRTAPPMVIWLSMLVLALLVAGGGVLYYLHHRGTPTVAVDPYPGMVRRDLALANSAKQPQQQDRYLAQAQTHLNRAVQSGAPAKTVQTLRQQLKTTSDTLHHITRVPSPVVLSDFSKFPSANPVEMAVSPGIVFVLDTGRHTVFSVTPNATTNPANVFQTGEQDSGFTLSNFLHIATSGTEPMALDDHDVLVRNRDGLKTATSLTAQVTGEKIVSMASVGADVYLLDTGTGQLWQYPNATAGFNPPASAFFTTPPTSLKSAVSVAFDTSGVYILLKNGTVLKYDMAHNPQHFALQPRTPLAGPNEIFTDVNLNYIWVSDPPKGRIVQFDKNGNYVRTYYSANGSAMDLHHLTNFAVGPAGNTFFVLADKHLYTFPVQH